MKQNLTRLFLACAAFGLLSLAPIGALALPADVCMPNPSECDIFEQVDIFQTNFLFISGDVVLIDSPGITVSDVLRLFNNVIDTGGGTGLGNTLFLYSVDEGNLPAPSTYSANAVTLVEGSTQVPALGLAGFVETNYMSNGTLYRVFSDEESRGIPEPATWQLLGTAVILMAPMMRRRLART